MGRFDKYYDAQDFILDIVKKELVGPVDENEILESRSLSDNPLHNYVTGILWAQRIEFDEGSPQAAAEPREVGLLDLPFDGDDAPVDNLTDVDDEVGIGAVNTTAVRKPSTMGISCILAADEKAVKVIFKYAKYGYSNEERKHTDSKGEVKRILVHKWARKSEIVELEFDFSKEQTWYKPKDDSILKGRGIEIVATNRRGSKSGARLITFTVTNLLTAQQQDIVQNESALFQCELRLIASKAFSPIEQDFVDEDIEGQILRMQYRAVKNYAQGHGCAAKANKQLNEIASCFIPTVEVNQMRSLESADKKLFSLQYLYTADRAEIITKLNDFLKGYRKFRDEQKNAAGSLGTFKVAVQKSIDNIETCIARVENGIKVLSTDHNAWRAFQLCNKSMFEQRVSMDLKRGKITVRSEYKDDPKWYPFQLFYLIMIIPDIAESNNKFNDAVDLLYFPTGGGKTEAYLAVSAFIIFYERITKPSTNHGVTILMRYTLRLLTIQQFERAAALICACEQIRKSEGMGGNEIAIGLWIGSDSSPNKLKDAAAVLDKIKAGESTFGETNPVQITACPHCGKRLDASNYFVNTEMIIKCPNGCFGNHLPIYIVDEDIYNRQPTLVISTVDKFARIVWEPRTAALFANPPRLIIQDELHLISGPLGTLTGIYESAIDKLCSSTTQKPKVIASTATVKRSKYQIKNLYNREVFQFPPNGIDATSSFFAEQATRNERPCRTYIGVTEQGGSMLDLFLRTFSAVSLANYYLVFKGTHISIIDQYYTMVGYFNALRDLGTSSTTLRERLEAYINSLLNTKFKKLTEQLGLPKEKYKFNAGKEGEPEKIEEREKGYRFGLFTADEPPRQIWTAELTSRRNAVEIKRMLDELNYSLTDADPAKRDLTFNYVLASNMFSVGVDIDRLGMMLVYGQPKSNSEYIQSTSRVGRSNPGIVFTALNSFRSRDRSFYENFYDYHNNFYKYVEATSVTPFSIRSIEKALHSVFVALVRHTVPGLNTNRGASAFRKSDGKVAAIKAYLLDRVRAIQPDAVSFADKYLDEFIEVWDAYAQGNALVYDKFKEGKDSSKYYSLLTAAESDDDDSYKTLNSVRNVDSNSNIFVRR